MQRQKTRYIPSSKMWLKDCNSQKNAVAKFEMKDAWLSSITAPQDAHKLVLEVVGWLTASLSGLARHELTTQPLVQA